MLQIATAKHLKKILELHKNEYERLTKNSHTCNFILKRKKKEIAKIISQKKSYIYLENKEIIAYSLIGKKSKKILIGQGCVVSNTGRGKGIQKSFYQEAIRNIKKGQVIKIYCIDTNIYSKRNILSVGFCLNKQRRLKNGELENEYKFKKY